MSPPKGKIENNSKESPRKCRDDKSRVSKKLKTSVHLLKKNVTPEQISTIVSNSSIRPQSKCDKQQNPSTSNSDDLMEWEPTELEIIKTVHAIRRDFSLPTNTKLFPNQPNKIHQSASVLVHLVIDTNIFLSHLQLLQQLVKDDAIHSKVQVHVPWVVMQELDHIKTTKKEGKKNLQPVARKAGSFIFEHIRALRIQTLDEYQNCINLLLNENSDDKILQWCLHLKQEMQADIHLLSNDVLFCAKASACGILALQSKNFMLELPKMLSSASTSNQKPHVNTTNLSSSSNSSKSSISIQPFSKTSEKERVRPSHEFCPRFERLLVDPLSQVLEYEMKQAFDDLWLYLVLLKPPWTLSDILCCMEKHWIAVFGYIYPRDMRDKLSLLNNLWKKYRTSVSDIANENCEMLVDSAISILHLIHSKRQHFHSMMKTAIDGLKDMVNENQLPSDDFILKLFTLLWERFNFVCGTLSDRAGVHDHGLVYKAGSVIPDKQEMVNGLEMMAPLLTNLETAMSRFFNVGNILYTQHSLLEDCTNDFSSSLCQAVSRLGIKLENHVSPSALSRALKNFASNAQQRDKMRIGLDQLRMYLRVLHSASSRFRSQPLR